MTEVRVRVVKVLVMIVPGGAGGLEVLAIAGAFG